MSAIKNTKSKKALMYIGLAFLCGVIVYNVLPMLSDSYGEVDYVNDSKNPESGSEESASMVKDMESTNASATKEASEVEASTSIEPAPVIIPVTHIATPEVVKAAYSTAWTMSSTKARTRLLDLIDKTELNAIVIDIKDSTGRISFKVPSPEVESLGAPENRISNMRALAKSLHDKNIYIIGRISVFQDPYLTKAKPEWAIKKKSDGAVWKDYKGLSFLDPTNENVYKYIVALAKDSYNEGFDEINFDYIRYPSDGDLQNIDYNIDSGNTRAGNIEAFFKYLHRELKKDTDIPMSADLFGLTTEVTNDMGIGQVWEKALPYFDFISPMVYPSHYPSGYNGYKNPSVYPYEVIDRALKSAVKRTEAAEEDILKIRPWLQDFNLGATYTKDMIQAEMKAVYDNSLTSWMLWDPANTYTPEALKVENEQ